MTWNIINGNSAEILKTYPDNTFDCVVTDPPYGISFLGKDWDHNTGDREVYEQCLRVLKPGGHLLAFSAARTYHHLAMIVETVGFEIRDQIMWIYGSGFPKSQDVGKQIAKTNIDNQWYGWGTQLKPAHEPIVMARKPVIGSIRENVLEHGTGAINIDACRVGERFPANVMHDGSDEVVSLFPHSTSGARKSTHKLKGLDTGKQRAVFGDDAVSGKYNVQPFTDAQADEGSAARFFYCPKVNSKERHIGTAENNHPTVKPIELMKYLIKLVTPPNGHILDPFNGSGSTGCAAVELGFDYTGIELDPNYVEIATKRISHWETECKPKTTYNNLFEEK